ncbi:MAG: hypothetical protein ACX98W_16200 [bacterium]
MTTRAPHTPRFDSPRPPVLLESAFEDPESIHRLVHANAPYWEIMRYLATPQELAAVSRSPRSAPRFLPPWFRGDWAYDEPLVPGAETILENPRFIEAARTLFDAEVVRPNVVYVNLMAPLSFAGEGHIDVPAFRGIDRREFPIWLLQQMSRSGLFADWQIDIATAVSWFYEGDGGAFDYWAEGPTAPPRTLQPPFSNRAVVGDNDFMFHRVGTVGEVTKTLEAGLESELMPAPDDSGDWIVRDRDEEIARYPYEAIRISVSWKAEVFADDAARRVREEHLDDLTLDGVVDRFLADLSDRGLAIERPADPLEDPDFMAALSDVYRIPDLVYPTAEETTRKASVA